MPEQTEPLVRRSGAVRVGDTVRLVTGDEMDGFVGKIVRPAHPASPWTWVVFNLAGARPIWSRAVTDREIEHA